MNEFLISFSNKSPELLIESHWKMFICPLLHQVLWTKVLQSKSISLYALSSLSCRLSRAFAIFWRNWLSMSWGLEYPWVEWRLNDIVVHNLLFLSIFITKNFLQLYFLINLYIAIIFIRQCLHIIASRYYEKCIRLYITRTNPIYK